MKTYLKDLTPEEVIDRLKAGEVVKNDICKNTHKVVDGVLCRFYPDGRVVYNAELLVDEPILEYFETPDELKLEVGKCYKTRDGRKAFVSHYDDAVDRFYGVVSLYTKKDTWQGWKENGHTSFNDKEHNLYLISEWSDDEKEEND